MKTVSKKWIHTGRTIYTTVTDLRSRHPEQRQAILSIAEGWSDKEAAELCERIVRLPELEKLIDADPASKAEPTTNEKLLANLRWIYARLAEGETVAPGDPWFALAHGAIIQAEKLQNEHPTPTD